MKSVSKVAHLRLAPLALGLSLGLLASAAHALPTINLTDATYNGVAASSTGTMTHNAIGNVVFSRDATQPAGTGVFNPFLRLDVKGNRTDEQGYNTSATITEGPKNNQTTRKILDNMSPENWTHDVLISDLQLTTDGKFYEFKLDINEPGNAMSLLSLDGLKLYSTASPSQDTEVLDGAGNIKDGGNGLVGTKLWDMDAGADRSVLLDARLSGGPGSGIADMIMLVDKKLVDNQKAAGENYFILWSRFGLEQAANTDPTDADAGFEEWSYRQRSGTPPDDGGGPVPTPGTAALAVLALALLRSNRRKSVRSAD
jgi:MYXO-CTERM domain-containing protein